MGIFKNIWGSFRYKPEMVVANPEILHDDTKMGWNIYVPANKTRREFVQEFTKVHKNFKYKLVVPGLFLAKKFLPPYKHFGVVPSNIYNREWVIFEKSFNDAMEDMVAIFYYQENIKEGISTEDAIKRCRENPAYLQHLKTVKQSAIYICMMDTWYHEFGVFLMHRIYQNMAKEFDGKEYNRILYTSKAVTDPHWLIMQTKITESVNIELIEQERRKSCGGK